MQIQGVCDPAFENVRRAFATNFERGHEVGACVAVTLDGRFVVDLWAGEAVQGRAAWQRDSLVNVYSTTKTMAALVMLMLADRGELELDAPVARYWPEFARNGKRDVLVRHVMAHTSGLSGFEPPVRSAEELYDWESIVARLADQTPWWKPGDGSGYHAVTQGYLQGELVRRVTGRSLGSFFRDEVARPLDADFHIGLPPEHDARVGELVPPERGLARGGLEPGSLAQRTLASCDLDGREPRTRAWRAAEIPAAGGIGHARSVARVHAAIACGGALDGVRLLSEHGVRRIFDEQSNGPDRVLGLPVRFGMGFGLSSPAWPIGRNPHTCYWGGWGGSLAIVDLDARVSIAYVMNKMAPSLVGDLRGVRIALASYEALAALGR